jgi:hypothetical protein
MDGSLVQHVENWRHVVAEHAFPSQIRSPSNSLSSSRSEVVETDDIPSTEYIEHSGNPKTTPIDGTFDNQIHPPPAYKSVLITPLVNTFNALTRLLSIWLPQKKVLLRNFWGELADRLYHS